MAGWSASQNVPEDVHVRDLVWNGSIPLRVELAAKEVTTLTPPPPLFLMAPRLGYLPLLASKIEPHFRATLPPGTDTIWFEYQGLPLKWHIPIGVLFDLLAEKKTLPWPLTVHFRTYPSDLLIPIEGEETMKWSYMNALKEAVYIMHGSTKPVMSLSQRDQEELWRSISEGDSSAHEKAASSLGSGGASGSRAKLVPLRLYLRQAREAESPVGKWDEVAFTTRCADAIDAENGFPMTLGRALNKALPQLFDNSVSPQLPVPTMALGRRMSNLDIEPSTSRRSSTTGDSTDSPRDPSRRELPGGDVASGGAGTGGGTSDMSKGASVAGGETSEASNEERRSGLPEGGSGTPRESESGESDDKGLEGKAGGGSGKTELGKEVREDMVERKFGKGLVVRIQGTEPQADVPLDWLSRNLSHPDQFLHVCIWRQEAQAK